MDRFLTSLSERKFGESEAKVLTTTIVTDIFIKIAEDVEALDLFVYVLLKTRAYVGFCWVILSLRNKEWKLSSLSQATVDLFWTKGFSLSSGRLFGSLDGITEPSSWACCTENTTIESMTRVMNTMQDEKMKRSLAMFVLERYPLEQPIPDRAAEEKIVYPKTRNRDQVLQTRKRKRDLARGFACVPDPMTLLGSGCIASYIPYLNESDLLVLWSINYTTLQGVEQCKSYCSRCRHNYICDLHLDAPFVIFHLPSNLWNDVQLQQLLRKYIHLVEFDGLSGVENLLRLRTLYPRIQRQTTSNVPLCRANIFRAGLRILDAWEKTLEDSIRYAPEEKKNYTRQLDYHVLFTAPSIESGIQLVLSKALLFGSHYFVSQVSEELDTNFTDISLSIIRKFFHNTEIRKLPQLLYLDVQSTNQLYTFEWKGRQLECVHVEARF